VLEKPPNAVASQSAAPAVRRKRPRARRHTSNPEALITAGSQLFAVHGPADVSIRQIAEAAGCSHTLVGRHFGSKSGLERAVVERLIQQLPARVEGIPAHKALWEWCGQEEHHGPLLTRCVLGELENSALFVESLRTLLPEDPRQTDITQRFGWYLGLGTVIGFVSLQQWLVTACHLHDLQPEETSSVVLRSADQLSKFRPSSDLASLPRRRVTLTPPTDFMKLDSRTALVTATIQLLGRPGPTSLTTRAIAEHAEANQGLIYHYFKSREDLLATALTEASQTLTDALSRTAPLDLNQSFQVTNRGLAVPLLARVLVNGLDIREIRKSYPVAERLIAEAQLVPAFSGNEPQIRSMNALACSGGVVLGGNPLRKACGLRTSDDVAGPMSEALRFALLG